MLASWGYKNGPLTSKNRRGPLNPIQTDLKYKKFTVFNEYTQARMKEHEHGYRQTCVFCSCLRTWTNTEQVGLDFVQKYQTSQTRTEHEHTCSFIPAQELETIRRGFGYYPEVLEQTKVMFAQQDKPKKKTNSQIRRQFEREQKKLLSELSPFYNLQGDCSKIIQIHGLFVRQDSYLHHLSSHLNLNPKMAIPVRKRGQWTMPCARGF